MTERVRACAASTFAIAAALSVLVVANPVALAQVAGAPKVTRTTPAHGDDAVSPTLGEVVVEFDRDMRQDGFSFVGGGPTFPELAGRPFWRDARTCVLPVKLNPGHGYRMSINGGRFLAFQSTAGVPVTPTPLRFQTAAEGGSGALTPAANDAAIAKLEAAVRDHYSYRDRVVKDWSALFAKHGRQLRAAKTPFAFTTRAAGLLGAAQDVHVWLRTDGGNAATYQRPAVTARPTPQGLRSLGIDVSRARSGVVYAVLEDGAGYLRIGTWQLDAREGRGLLFEALRAMEEAPGLIIDVRANGGGNEAIAQQLAGCFVDEPVVYAKQLLRDPTRDGADSQPGFAGPFERVLQPAGAEAPRYRGKIAVLQGPATMSSCEGFVLMMRQVKGCTTIGARTFGSSGNPKPHDLGNGVTVYLPSWKALDADGKPFEGEGLAPDVTLHPKPSAFATGDPIIEKALELLRETQ